MNAYHVTVIRSSSKADYVNGDSFPIFSFRKVRSSLNQEPGHLQVTATLKTATEIKGKSYLRFNGSVYQVADAVPSPTGIIEYSLTEVGR